MLPRAARALLPLLVWSVSAASAPAAGSEQSVWAQAVGAAPLAWAWVIFAGILAAALAAHLGFSLSEWRGAPAALNARLKQAMEASNYQEAWEICGQWPAAYLSRVLRPAIERIGQGRDGVVETLDLRLRRERRGVTVLTWALVGIGVAAPLLAVLVAWVRWNAQLRTDQAFANARALTMAEGDFVLLAAAGLGVAMAALIFWLGFRARARAIFTEVASAAPAFVNELPYDDLEGLHIGREFDAGTLLGGEDARQMTGALRVSRDLTSSCPQCNAPINFTQKNCPNCAAALEWN